MGNKISDEYLELDGSFVDVFKEANIQLNNSASAADAFKNAMKGIPSILKRGKDAVSDFIKICVDMPKNISAADSVLKDVTNVLQPLVESSVAVKEAVGNAGDAVKGFKNEAENANNSLANGLATGFVNLGIAIGGILLDKAIEYIVDFKEKQKNVAKASEDLGPLLKNMGGRFKDSGEDAIKASKGLHEYNKNINDIIKSHADFNQTVIEKAYQFSVDTTLVDQYKESINKLAGKTDLTADKQAELENAVAGLNKICGTNIQVLDARNGKLSESIAVINHSTDAWERNNKAQEAQEASLYYAEELIKATDTRVKAEEELNAALAKAKTRKDEDGKEVVIYTQKLIDLEAEVVRCKNEEKALGEQLKSSKEALQENQIVTTSSYQGIKKYIEGSSAWEAALEGSEYTTHELTAAFAKLGVTTGELEKTGADNFALLAKSFDGGADDLMAKCVELGIFMPKQFEKIADELGPAIALGYLDGLDPECAKEIIQEMGEETIAAMRASLEIESPSRRAAKIGMYLAEGFSQGIEDDESADLAAKRIAYLTLQTMEAEAAAEKASAIGEDFSAGFAEGMRSLQHAVEASGSAASRAAKAGMESESTNASTWGGHMVGGLADGIRGAVGLVQNAASFIAGNIKSFLHFSRPDKGPLRDYETWMPDMVGGLASSLRRAAPVIYAEARAVAEGISENINDWEISTSNLRKSAMYDLATKGFPSASLHGVGTTNNYYTIDGVNYVPDSRMAELMAEVMNILVRENNMRRVSYA